MLSFNDSIILSVGQNVWFHFRIRQKSEFWQIFDFVEKTANHSAHIVTPIEYHKSAPIKETFHCL